MASYNDYLEYLKHIDNTTQQEITAKVDGLNNDIAHLKENLVKLNKIKDDLTNNLNEANNKVRENSETLILKEAEITTLKSDIASFSTKLKEFTAEIAKLEKQKSNEEKKKNEYAEQLKYVKETQSTLQSDFESSKKTLKSHFDEIQNLQVKLSNAEKSSQNLNATKVDLENRIQKFKSEIDNLNSIIENLKNNNYSNKITSLEAKISTLTINVRQIEIDKTNLTNELTSSQEYAKQLNKTLTEKNEQLKNVAPQNKLKYILIAIFFLLLITSIYYYSKYNNLHSKYDYLEYKNSSDSNTEAATTAKPTSNNESNTTENAKLYSIPDTPQQKSTNYKIDTSTNESNNLITKSEDSKKTENELIMGGIKLTQSEIYDFSIDDLSCLRENRETPEALIGFTNDIYNPSSQSRKNNQSYYENLYDDHTSILRISMCVKALQGIKQNDECYKKLQVFKYFYKNKFLQKLNECSSFSSEIANAMKYGSWTKESIENSINEVYNQIKNWK